MIMTMANGMLTMQGGPVTLPANSQTESCKEAVAVRALANTPMVTVRPSSDGNGRALAERSSTDAPALATRSTLGL